MSTLLELKTLAASYLGVSPSALTVNGLDLFLEAANQVRKTAELNNDFEFSRKLVTVSVDGATGGDLGTAVDGNADPVLVKTVIEAGLLDDNSNLIPVEWTTVAESIERQRQDTKFDFSRVWRTDAEVESLPRGRARFTFSGNSIQRWPRTEESEIQEFNLWLEVYSFQANWTSLENDVVVAGFTASGEDANGTYSHIGRLNDHNLYFYPEGDRSFVLFNSGTQWIIVESTYLGITGFVDCGIFVSTSQSPVGTYAGGGTWTGPATVTLGGAVDPVSDIWTTHGAQYILWASIVQLNHKWKQFVPRTEGNLPPPQQLASEGLQTLIDWDANKFEQFRRHNR